MKYRLIILLIVFACPVFAQPHIGNIYGMWVKCKAIYNDGTELPDDDPLKFTYFKYQFAEPDKIWISTTYAEKGTEMRFKLTNDYLIITTVEGGVINNFKASKLKDTVVLLQLGRDGLETFNAVKLYFVPEKAYQNAIPLKPDNIYAIKNKDTVYKGGPKFYATFNGNSFQRFIYDGLSEHGNLRGKSGHLAAGFIVSSTGSVDSLKIYESINEKFDKYFVKVFNRLKNEWIPAVYNDKPVSTYMTVDLRYSSFDTAMPAYLSGREANTAYDNKDYKTALYYFDEALKAEPTQKEVLLKRGMCKLYMGNNAGACEDWKKAKELGDIQEADALLQKYCK